MSRLTLRFIAAVCSIALLPLAVSKAPLSSPERAKSVLQASHVVTVSQPLDLTTISLSEFGDDESSN